MYVLYTEGLAFKSIEVTLFASNGLLFGKEAGWQSESAGSSINRETARHVGGCGLASDCRPTGPGIWLARPNITNATEPVSTCQDMGYPVWCYSRFYSDPPVKCQGSTAN